MKNTSTSEGHSDELESNHTTFVMIPDWVWQSDISRGAVGVYMILKNITGHDGKLVCYPKISTVAERARVSTRTVSTYINELKAIGALKVVNRWHEDGNQSSNRYILCFDEPDRGISDSEKPVSVYSKKEASGSTRSTLPVVPEADFLHNQIHLTRSIEPENNMCKTEFFPAVISKEIAIIDNDKETVASMFEEFWDAYGKKEARKPAVKAWNKVIKDPAMAEMVIAKAKESKATRNPDYVKLAGGWLLDERWNDEMVDRQANKSKSSSTINYLKELAQAEGLFND